MKPSSFTLICTALASAIAIAAPTSLAAPPANQADKTSERAAAIKTHKEGSKKLSLEQDDLSADVQDLIDEQTDPEVIKLLSEIERIMAEATDLLEQANTDGSTIAVETEVIEKIFDAAKKKQKQSGGT